MEESNEPFSDTLDRADKKLELYNMIAFDNSLVKEVESHFTSSFELEVLRSALESARQDSNPLSLNNFATNLRELGRIHLESEAPDEALKACAWFKQKYDQHGKPIIERAQRAKYIIQGELHDDFVKRVLEVEVDDTIRDYSQLIGSLSKLTHLTPAVIGISAQEASKQANEALRVLNDLFSLVRDRRRALLVLAEGRAKAAVRDLLYQEVNEALDRLSTHTTVEYVALDELGVSTMNAREIEYAGRGQVYVRLQYGSDLDVTRDDGYISIDCYPFTCAFVAETSLPLDITIVSGALEIDTDSFYGIGEADN